VNTKKRPLLSSTAPHSVSAPGCARVEKTVVCLLKRSGAKVFRDSSTDSLLSGGDPYCLPISLRKIVVSRSQIWSDTVNIQVFVGFSPASEGRLSGFLRFDGLPLF
jgi:hypothetical protein